jgi:putative nucleotidyltransferase with HDIG domain
MKQDHSRRVCKESLDMAEDLGFNGHEKETAAVLGLLHDIGRFEQMRRYGTFNDSESVDHGELGAEIIREKGVIATMDREDQQMVLSGIVYHNRFKIPPGLAPKSAMHCRVLRDADKIDIYQVISEFFLADMKRRNHQISGGGKGESGYSPALVQALLKKENIDAGLASSSIDRILLRLSWVFDFNYDRSLGIVHERGYLEGLLDALPDSEEFMTLKIHFRRAVKDRLGRYRSEEDKPALFKSHLREKKAATGETSWKR